MGEDVFWTGRWRWESSIRFFVWNALVDFIFCCCARGLGITSGGEGLLTWDR